MPMVADLPLPQPRGYGDATVPEWARRNLVTLMVAWNYLQSCGLYLGGHCLQVIQSLLLRMSLSGYPNNRMKEISCANSWEECNRRCVAERDDNATHCSLLQNMNQSWITLHPHCPTDKKMNKSWITLHFLTNRVAYTPPTRRAWVVSLSNTKSESVVIMW